MHAYHRTMVALEKPEDEQINPLDYAEYQIASAIGSLKDIAGKAYAIARAKQIIQEAEAL